jgi:hypothetical protein
VRFVLGFVASALAACFTKPDRPGTDPTGDAPGGGDGWLDGWAFRKRVEIHPNVASTLANFPIAVVREGDADLEAHASPEGRDIVATADDGETLLSRELARYETGDLELWVRIPELTDGTAIYVYYGGDDQPASTAAWDGPFAGVWHLSDGGNAIDSTSRRTSLAAGTLESTPGIAPNGAFGRARVLDGNDVLDGGDPADGSLDFGTGSFSYTLWVFQTGVLGLYDSPFYKGGGSASEVGYCWLLGTDGGWTAKLHDGTEDTFLELGPPASFANRWVHLAAVVDRAANTFRVYADGGEAARTSLEGVGSLSTPFSLLVGRGTDDNPFQGMLDEVRIYNTALEPDWIRAEVENSRASTFLEVDAEEARP